MGQVQELIEAPLSTEELAMRYRALCDDPCFANVPGKIELDVWGRMVMSPASTYHGRVQANLTYKLKGVLGGHVITEAPIATPTGLFVADLAWASPGYMTAHGSESPFMRAPELCIEVVSSSNSVRELAEKRDAYLAVGAEEVWLVYPQSKRCEFYGKHGPLPRSAYAVDLSDIFS
ncbi:MAG TPA: Uma2 family endonuclease [Burkholderiales bacterium]|nr:Uma2 family endonuclease [Burkholderiales bacterium]